MKEFSKRFFIFCAFVFLALPICASDMSFFETIYFEYEGNTELAYMMYNHPDFDGYTSEKYYLIPENEVMFFSVTNQTFAQLFGHFGKYERFPEEYVEAFFVKSIVIHGD